MRYESIDVLYTTPWMEVKKANLKEPDGAYIYQSLPWCYSQGVAVLCYREKGRGCVKETEYLGRYEVCPAHSMEMELCALTGGYDNVMETHSECAIRELKEEGGLSANPGELKYLGTVKPSKSSDHEISLYAVNVKDCVEVKAEGDGTVLEEDAYVKWVTERDAVYSKDPLLATMINRLRFELLK